MKHKLPVRLNSPSFAVMESVLCAHDEVLVDEDLDWTCQILQVWSDVSKLYLGCCTEREK